MQCLRRPVPSETALRLLRRLAYDELPGATATRKATRRRLHEVPSPSLSKPRPSRKSSSGRVEPLRRSQKSAIALLDELLEVSHLVTNTGPDSVEGKQAQDGIRTQQEPGTSQKAEKGISEEPYSAESHVELVPYWTARLSEYHHLNVQAQRELRWLGNTAETQSRVPQVECLKEAPTSITPLLLAAIHLGLGELSHVAIHEAKRGGVLPSMVDSLLSALAQSKRLAGFRDSLEALQALHIKRNILDTIDASEQRAQQILNARVLALIYCIDLQATQHESSDDESDTLLEALGNSLEALCEVHGNDLRKHGYWTVMRDLLHQGENRAAYQLFARYTASAGVDISLGQWLQNSFVERADLDNARHVAHLALQRGGQRVSASLLRNLWSKSRSDHDALQNYCTLDLEGTTTTSRNSLIYAMAKHMSHDVLCTEMFGPRARMWAGTVARIWEDKGQPLQAVREIGMLQSVLGDRPLNPVLYETAARLCREAGMADQVSALNDQQKALLKLHDNFETIMKLFHAAESQDWDLVQSTIEALDPDGFGTMQPQTRVRLFDPLIGAIASTSLDVQRIFELGIALTMQISGDVSRIKGFVMLLESLTRCGNIDMASKIHEYSDTVFAIPVRLTPIDISTLWNAFYLEFRPSTLVMATALHRLYSRDWTTTSRLCLPLLVTSASHQKKSGQQERVADAMLSWTFAALDNVDDGSFRAAIVADAPYGYRMRQAGDHSIYQQALPRDKSGDARVTSAARPAPLLYTNLIELAPPAEVESSDDISQSAGPSGDAAGAESQRYESGSDSSTQSAHGSSVNALGVDHNDPPELHAQRGLDELLDDFEDGSTDAGPGPLRILRENTNTPAVHSDEAHFNFLKTKAGMLGSSSKGDNLQVTRIFEQSPLSNPVVQNAAMVSLAGKGLSSKLADAVGQLAETSGADTSLYKIPQLVEALARECDGHRANLRQLVDKLKMVITRDCERLRERHQHVDHSLATGVARIMLEMKKPGAAVELLRHSLQLPFAALRAPGTKPLVTLLRAYTRLGSVEGVEWAVNTLLTRNERLDGLVLRTLKDGRAEVLQHDAYMSTARQQRLLDVLSVATRRCLAQRDEQIQRAWELALQLADYAAAFSTPAHENNGTSRQKASRHATESARIDADIVATVCRDIMTLSARSHSSSRRPVQIPNAQDLRMPGHVAALEARRRRTASSVASARRRRETRPTAGQQDELDGLFKDSWGDVV